jgi:iron complex outermembrane receptor protein
MSTIHLNTLRAAIALAIVPALGYAAGRAPSDNTAPVGGVLDEVFVTAQKREESIQDVPITISAVSEDDIQRDLDNSPGDIARVVPNLYGNPTGGRAARPRWFLRGVGVNTSSLVSPVGVYADEVYQSALELHSLPLFDLERVEVLRGPQGTLWGKNTPGGAIHFVSRKPTFENDGYIKLGFGNLNQKELQAAFGGALVDGLLAGRIAYLQEGRDGWARNRYTGDKKAGAYDDHAVRGQLLFTPTSDFEALLNVHYRTVDSWAVPGYSIGIREGGADDFGYVSPVGPNPRIGDPVDRNNDIRGEQEQYGATLTVRWDIGNYTLTSITAYDEVDAQTAGDREQSPNEVIRTFDLKDAHQFSQEIRLASDPTEAFSWIVGAYYFNDTQVSDSTSATLPVERQVFGTFYQNTLADVDTESYAAFVNATYRFTERFKVNGGIRWTTETIGIDLEGVDGGPRGSTTYVDTERWWRRQAVAGPLRVNAFQLEENTWDAWTYDVSPSFALTPDVLLYGRYARGFRSGGYNASVTAQSSVNTVDPERVDSFEIGTKAQFFDGRLTTNAAVFYYEWKDMQLNIQGVTAAGLNGSTLRNAALGKAQGLELEINALPLEHLRLGLNVGLLDAEYSKFVERLANGTVNDYSGNKFARAPETTIGAEAEYEFVLPSGSAVVFGTDWAYQSRIYYSSVNQTDPFQQQGGYTLGNARLSYRTANQDLEVAAYVRNLTDKTYDLITVVPANGAYRTTPGYPQTYGVWLRKTFD